MASTINRIPINALQRNLLTVGSSVVALMDPFRHDLVAVLGETTGRSALMHMRRKMKETAEGREILQDRPVIRSHTINIPHLRTLPDGTFGSEYVQFLDKYNVSPDTRFPVQFVDDEELAYVMLRYREVHDLLHSVTGMPTNMQGEVAVKWIEAIQNRLPMCLGGAVFGPLRFKPKQRKAYREQYLPWALRNGSTSKFLLGIYYEKRWDQDLEEMRRELNLEPPP